MSVLANAKAKRMVDSHTTGAFPSASDVTRLEYTRSLGYPPSQVPYIANLTTCKGVLDKNSL